MERYKMNSSAYAIFNFGSFLLTYDLMAFFFRIFSYFAYRMKKFNVEVVEVLRHTIEVSAVDADEALMKVQRMYKECDLVLDASDYERTEISVKDEK